MGSSIGDEVSRCYVDMMLRGYANALLLNIASRLRLHQEAWISYIPREKNSVAPYMVDSGVINLLFKTYMN